MEINNKHLLTKQEIKLLIARMRKEEDNLITGYLLQTLGDMEAKDGNIEVAHSLHLDAINLDPNTPLPHLLYATGLIRAFNRPELALIKIQEIRSLLDSEAWQPNVNEPSLAWYINELDSLTEEIQENQ